MTQERAIKKKKLLLMLTTFFILQACSSPSSTENNTSNPGKSVLERFTFYFGNAEPVNSWKYGVDAQGSVVDVTMYFLSGADGVWFTDDDTDTGSYDVLTYNSVGEVIGLEKYDNGDDKIIHTSDDTLSYSIDSTFDQNATRVRTVRWENSEIKGYEEITAPAQKNTTDNNTPLLAATWFGPPFLQFDWRDVAVLDNPERIVSYRHGLNPAGPDNQWYSADDVVWQYFDFTYDAHGYFDRVTLYRDWGNDGVPMTADDRFGTNGGSLKLVYDSLGQVQSITFYNGVGFDDIALTEDDDVDFHFVLANETNMFIDYIDYGDTLDSVDLQDREIRYYIRMVKDLSGNITNVTEYTSAGTDEQWFTADDVIHVRLEYKVFDLP